MSTAVQMTTSSQPHMVLEGQIDATRCRGGWDQIPSLVSRLERQCCDPDGSALPSATPSLAVALAVTGEHILVTQGDKLKARTQFRKALKMDAQCEDALYFLAKLAMEEEGKRDELEDPLTLLTRIEWRQKEDFWADANALKHYAYRFGIVIQALYLKATLLEQSGDYRYAAKAYQDVCDLVAHTLLRSSSQRNLIPTAELSVLVGSCHCRQPMMHVLAGDPQLCIEIFRNTLLHPPLYFTDSLTAQVARSFGTMLSRGCSLVDYVEPPVTSTKGGSVYCPHNAIEEGTLLLQWYQHSVSASFRASVRCGRLTDATQQERQTVLAKNLQAVRTELCLLLGRAKQWDVLADVYRKAISTEMESSEMWFQLALALMASKNYMEAYLAITKSIQKDETHVMAMLVAAKLCLSYISKAGKAFNWAKRALDLVNSRGAEDAHLLVSCQSVYGIVCSKRAYQVHSFTERQVLQKEALAALEAAYTSAPRLQNVAFHLALLLADVRDVERSLTFVKKSLELDRTHSRSWNLLALLLTSKKRYGDAIQACDSGLVEKPNSSRLLLTKGNIYAHLGDFLQAINCYNVLVERFMRGEHGESLQLHVSYISLVDGMAPSAGRDKKKAASKNKKHRHKTKAAAAKRPVFNIRNRVEVSSHDSSSTVAAPGMQHSQPKQRQEEEAASTMSGIPVSNHPGVQHVAAAIHYDVTDRNDDPHGLVVEVLLAIARLYSLVGIKLDETMLDDAYDAVYKALEFASSAYVPTIHAMLGSLCWAQGNLSDAIRHYEGALAIDSHHVPSLVSLGALERNHVLAYGYLTSALEVDATSHEGWYEMAMLLQQEGKHAESCDHLLTSIDLERTAPVQPFESIRRTI